MSWEGRLRDMVLAGGTLLVAACSSESATSGRDAGSQIDFCCNANGDPCCEYTYCGGALTPACSAELACQAEGGTYDFSAPVACSFDSDAGVVDAGVVDASPVDALAQDSTFDSPVNSFCCNANADPCCEYQHCGGSLTPECSAELACEAEGGTYDPAYVRQPDGSDGPKGCSLPSDAGPVDASAQDSTFDSPVNNFCCNANPDPCCFYLECGGSLTPECSVELACRADGGTFDPGYVHQPDGSTGPRGCYFTHEAGTADAATSEPHDAGGG